VVDRRKLVRVIARADRVRQFARSDADIAEEIRERVVDALDVRDVTVSVREGRVLLEGQLDFEDDLERLPHAVARVPGVVSVDAHVEARSSAQSGPPGPQSRAFDEIGRRLDVARNY
jgi:hypothetical protein